MELIKITESDITKREKVMDSLGLNEEQQAQVQSILDTVDITLHPNLTGTFTLPNKTIYHVKPLNRRLAKGFVRILDDLSSGVKDGKITGYATYDATVEACLNHSITKVEYDGKAQPLDLDEMSEPDYDMLAIYFQSYYIEYKKKSMKGN